MGNHGKALATGLAVRTTARTLKDFGTRKVLIIDDDHDILMSFATYFELEDYQVLTARNGKEALDLLESVDEKELPDLIFLDHQMPVMDGSAFSRSRKQVPRIQNIPVVLTTASSRLSHLVGEVDADAYLAKPLSVDQLRNLSLRLIHQRQETRVGFFV